VPNLFVSICIGLFGCVVGVFVTLLVVEITHLRREVNSLSEKAAEAERELANLNRLRQNKLYREAIEDYGFANAQAALRVAQLRHDLEVVETILKVGKP
jgi:hypothetical protein